MKKQRIFMLALCCLLLCGFAACGRDKNNSNNNSVTNPTTTPTVTSTPLPKNPTTTPGADTDRQDNLGDGIMDGIEDAGDGIINGAEDVIDGAGNAIEDIGDGLTGDDTNSNNQR